MRPNTYSTPKPVAPAKPTLQTRADARAIIKQAVPSRLGAVSPEQRTAHAEIIAAGGVVEVAKGFDAAVAVLAAWGAISPG